MTKVLQPLVDIMYSFIYVGLIILVIIFGIIIISLILQNEKFKKSGYNAATGNSFRKTRFNAGNYGEYLIFLILEKLPIYKRILANVYVPKGDGNTSEIDVVMISENGIFVFESKNYSGWIFGDEKSAMWTQSLKGGLKNRFYNPIKQNSSHIKALSKYIDSFGLEVFKSYIVFSERCELKKVIVKLPNVALIKRNNLIEVIKAEIIYTSFCLTQEQVDDIYNRLKIHTNVSEAEKLRHVQSLKKKNKGD